MKIICFQLCKAEIQHWVGNDMNFLKPPAFLKNLALMERTFEEEVGCLWNIYLANRTKNFIKIRAMVILDNHMPSYVFQAALPGSCWN